MRMRKYARRSYAARGAPDRQWVSLQANWSFSAITGTTTSALVVLQAPTDLSNLTADPPEALTILRIKGDFAVSVSVTGSWALALMVQDTTWSPSTFAADSDKRMLWVQTYEDLAASTLAFVPPGLVSQNNVLVTNARAEATHIDVAPKARIQTGQALYLVAYELSGAAEFTLTARTVRALVQRTGRRR